MIQAANQTLSLTCFRSFFLDGTFRARHDFCSLLELFLHNSFFFWDCPVKRRILVENSFTINFYQLSFSHLWWLHSFCRILLEPEFGLLVDSSQLHFLGVEMTCKKTICHQQLELRAKNVGFWTFSHLSWLHSFCRILLEPELGLLVDSSQLHFLGASRWPAKRQIINNWSWI